MNILLISANPLPAFPIGPVYLAGALRQAGHEVALFETCFASHLDEELSLCVQQTQPDVVGISIRLVFADVLDASAEWGTRHTDLRPYIRQIVQVVRQHTSAVIVLGGAGFNYYACDWLAYLDVPYGIRGEGEQAFVKFLERMRTGSSLLETPGCVDRSVHDTRAVPPARLQDFERLALPAYDLLDMPRYAASSVLPAILTKRGCAFSCSYCPYASLEGKRYRLKPPERILAEVRRLLQTSALRKAQFCDNSFNAPGAHARGLCQALVRADLDFQWSTGDLKPVALTEEFCRLMKDSGCFSVNLAIESASQAMLERMQRGYGVEDVRQSLEALSRSGLPFGASLMLGAPGESPQTVEETLRLLEDYEIPGGVWVTVGVYLWTEYQQIVRQLLAEGYIRQGDLFEGAVYLSPALSPAYLGELCARLRARPGWKVQVNRAAHGWDAGAADFDRN